MKKSLGWIIAIIVIVVIVIVVAGGKKNTQPRNNSNDGELITTFYDYEGDLEFFDSWPVDGEFRIDAQRSGILWAGYKVTGEHYGRITEPNGLLEVVDGNIEAFGVTLDLSKNLYIDDLEGEEHDQLMNHLQSAEFFNVEETPNIIFAFDRFEVVDGVQPTAYGFLQMNGITKPIQAPVDIEQLLDEKEDTYRISGFVELDRTEWDMTFNSGKFIENLGDSLVEDYFDVEFEFVLTEN